MTLDELKYVLDQMYGYDITRKTRVRERAYAKKVFITLAKDFGFRWKDIVKVIGQKHDVCIWHHKTFGDIKPMDLMMYNACIDYFNLTMTKIPNVQAINGNPVLDKVLYQIKSLSLKDLKYFDSKLLDIFLKKLKHESSLVKEEA